MLSPISQEQRFRNVTLDKVARKLVMELEPKVREVELIRDCEKNPLVTAAMKEAKLYLNHIKTDRYRIKYFVDCFLWYTAKRQLYKSASSDSEPKAAEKEGKTYKQSSSSKQRERES